MLSVVLLLRVRSITVADESRESLTLRHFMDGMRYASSRTDLMGT